MKTALSLIITVALAATLPQHACAGEMPSRSGLNLKHTDMGPTASATTVELALTQPLRGGDYGV